MANRRLDKLEELLGDKPDNNLLLAFVEEDLDKMEVLGSGENSSGLLFSGNISDGNNFLKAKKFQRVVIVPGSKEWGR
ncbi:MAG: hypothetical protein ACYCV0_19665 [Desulfitobacteriaceae bacterium]